ncbi:MAG TPA: TIGR03016 family PEP-CTERM system-associated outer membrane protein [Ideonella sp.]|nr:TIGR03016 family PEP-CTERM system-associated outer membrane protein [Ideonella sp.]
MSRSLDTTVPARASRHAVPGTSRRRGLCRHGLTPLSAAVAVWLPLAAHGQVWNTAAALEMSTTVTDNGALSENGAERSDLITSLKPQVRIARRGANFGFTAALSAELVNYANHSEADRVLPAADVKLESTIVERLVFLDASADVKSVESDPFQGLVDAAPGSNTDTVSTLRISPYLDYQISPRLSLVARADESLATTTQDATPDRRSHQMFVRLSQKPLPLGAALELSRQATSYSEQSSDDLTTEAARLSLSYTLDGQFLVGAIVGQERNDFQGEKQSDAIAGLQFQWVPGPRTDLRARVEHRFFGTGWDLAFSHRTPFMTMAVAMNREPVGFSGISALASDNDLNQYLDAILTTRYPDPVSRQAQVDEVINSRNLRTRFPEAVDTLSGYAQLRSRASATLVWLGSRNTFSISGYSQTLRRLTRSDEPAADPVDNISDSRQTGAAVEINRRLTPQMSLGAVAQWAKVVGLAARDGDESHERSLRVSLSRNLSPRTTLAVGLQYRELRTTVAALNSYDETSGFAALSLRY